MFVRINRAAILSLVIFSGLLNLALAESPASAKKPTIEEIGDQRYRIGAIIIDKASHKLTVPGRLVIKEFDAPLEFLASTRGGMKAYESLFELEADAFEFNLAAILIGLDANNATPPQHHFSPEPVTGDPLTIWVSWQLDGEEKRVGACDVLLLNGKTIDGCRWVYIGSQFTPEGQYLAQMDGTLIGFAHDPASIIEHQAGLGLGDYGAITTNDKLVPAAGQMIKLIIEAGNDTVKKTHADTKKWLVGSDGMKVPE